MKKTAIIFDLDGTLLYTLEDLTDSTNFALEKINCSKCSLDKIRSYIGNGVQKLIERAIPEGKEHQGFSECLKIFKSHYEKNMYNKTSPFDGVQELLDDLKRMDLKIAVVSNKFDSAVKELCRYYFHDKIDFAAGESGAVRKKPSPDGVFEVMKQLGVKAEECVYVGDSEVDIQTAKNAGVNCISVDWGYKDRFFLKKNGADVVVSTCEELLSEILK